MNVSIKKLSSEEQALSEKTLFEARELKENHAEMKNTLMEEKDNRFRSLGGGHTALLSYHSHREYFKASNCENSAVFLGFQTGFFRFSLLQPMAVPSNSARSVKSRFR